MRAVRCAQGVASIVDVPPTEGEGIRIRVASVGICGSDLHLLSWNLPATLGHEMAGFLPDGTAVEKALEIAGVIGANGPLAVEAIKRSVRETEGMSEVDGLAHELEIGWPIFASNDAAEGQKAFAEKRPPTYTRT